MPDKYNKSAYWFGGFLVAVILAFSPLGAPAIGFLQNTGQGYFGEWMQFAGAMIMAAGLGLIWFVAAFAIWAATAIIFLNAIRKLGDGQIVGQKLADEA